MNDVVRSEVRQIAPYNAGLTVGEVQAKAGANPIAKLGSNESPIGAGSAVWEVLRTTKEQLHIYPDPHARALKSALSASLGCHPSCLIVGNGSEDILSVICRTVVRSGDRIVTPYPSFPLHEDYAALMGAKIERVPVRTDFSIDMDRLVMAARNARILFLSNPMNPTGSWLDADQLKSLVDRLPTSCLFVLDEAYYEYAMGDDYADGLRVLEKLAKPWMLLRTFSKAYGLAGLRVGYGIASSAELRDMMDRVRTPFNVNGLAQVAAVAALADANHLKRVVKLATVERTRLLKGLADLGYRVAPSRGNFLFVDCEGPSVDVSEYLLRQGVIVKPWRQAGFDNFIRVTVGSETDNDQFIAALARSATCIVANAPVQTAPSSDSDYRDATV